MKRGSGKYQPSALLITYYNEQLANGSRGFSFDILSDSKKERIANSIGYKAWLIGKDMMHIAAYVVAVTAKKVLEKRPSITRVDFTKGGIVCAYSGTQAIAYPNISHDPEQTISRDDLLRLLDVLEKRFKNEVQNKRNGL